MARIGRPQGPPEEEPHGERNGASRPPTVRGVHAGAGHLWGRGARSVRALAGTRRSLSPSRVLRRRGGGRVDRRVRPGTLRNALRGDCGDVLLRRAPLHVVHSATGRLPRAHVLHPDRHRHQPLDASAAAAGALGPRRPSGGRAPTGGSGEVSRPRGSRASRAPEGRGTPA